MNAEIKGMGAMTAHIDDTEDLKSQNNVVVDYAGASAKSSAHEIALVKKLDMRVMPTLWCMFFMNYLDRNAIANARLNRLEKEINLQKVQYNTTISVFFAGYLLMQIPSNMLLSSKKVRPSLYMSAAMIAWATVSCCTALVKNYHGLVVVRFLLGVTEAPFYPGALYLLSIFYTRKEIATRIAILYTGNIFATSFAGLIAAATFASIDHHRGLSGWQWLFLIEGIITIAVACVAVFLLPDHPASTQWLTPEERDLAVKRINRDTVGLTEDRGAMVGFKEAFCDPKLYLLAFMQNMHLSACSFNNFFPTVVGSVGFSTTITLVLTCPPYLVSGFFGWFVGLSSGKFNERTWHITACMRLALAGFIISCATMNVAARYVSCFLFVSGAYAVNSVILGWVTASMGETSEKKAVALSFVSVASNASYIYTPYLYPKTDGPKYLVAMGANAGFAMGTIAAAWAMMIWLKVLNKRITTSGDESRVKYAY